MKTPKEQLVDIINKKALPFCDEVYELADAILKWDKQQVKTTIMTDKSDKPYPSDGTGYIETRHHSPQHVILKWDLSKEELLHFFPSAQKEPRSAKIERWWRDTLVDWIIFWFKVKYVIYKRKRRISKQSAQT